MDGGMKEGMGLESRKGFPYLSASNTNLVWAIFDNFGYL